MNRLDDIINNKLFTDTLHNIERLEQDRKYCRHGLSHLLEVARTAYILKLEQNIDVPKDVIYAAALLHDIGRAEQYSTGQTHETAGVPIARSILNRSRFTPEEQEDILLCVRCHRGQSDNYTALQKLICQADKRSRACFYCDMLKDCKWSDNQKNMSLDI